MSLLIGILLIVLALALAWGAGWLMARHDRKVYESTSAAPTVPEPVPELSCFVKGLIRSMQETPTDWSWIEDAHSVSHGRTYSRTSWAWKHTSGLTVHMVRSRYRGDDEERRNAYVQDHSLYGHDAHGLFAGTQTYLDNPRAAAIAAKRAAEQAVKDARLAAIRAPFEALGCPADRESGTISLP